MPAWTERGAPSASFRRFLAAHRRRTSASPVALVTGAASGIGAALTEALVRADVRVIALDRDLARCQERVARLPSGASAVARALDVTDPDGWSARVEEVLADEERIDLLFNNAGVGLAGEITGLSLEDWQRVIEVNLWGTIHGIRAVYPTMVAQRAGVIVNTASGAGLCPRPGMVAYASAKHAVVGLSTSLRAEAAEYGVQVHAVCPGYVQTDIMRTTVFRGVDGETLQASIPLRPVTADDCARIALAGVAANRGIIPVSKTTTLEWWLWRWAPGVVERVAAARARAFRKHARPL